jgi:hypothetical protein
VTCYIKPYLRPDISPQTAELLESVRARTAIVHFSEPVAAATARLVKARNGLTVDQPI